MARAETVRPPFLPDFLRDRSFLANAAGHTTVDVLNSTVSLLLALLSVPLGLNNTQIGLIATAYTFANSLTQPLFGWLADRYGERWIGPAGILWMSIFFTLSANAPGWWALVFLVTAALGSAAYHPQGTMRAGRVPLRQVVTATAVFFLFGQMGSAVGPSVAGVLLENWGRQGLMLLAAANLLVGLWIWQRGNGGRQDSVSTEIQHRPSVLRLSAPMLLLFATLLFTRMTVQSTTGTFLPKYLQDHGWAPASYGLLLSMVMLGSALGNVVGGSLSDRIGRRRLVAGSMFLAAPALWFYLDSSGPLLYFLLLLIGLCTGAGHSVNVVMAQSMLPARKALASGLVLGFMFAGGAIGAAIAGWVGDQIGLDVALRGMAIVAIMSGISALPLPSTRHLPS